MSLSQKDVEEYQVIHKEVFGEEASYEDAYEQASKLMCLMRHIYKPMTEEELELYSKEMVEHYMARLASETK